MIEKIIKIAKEHYGLVILLILGFLPFFTWFKGDHLIAFGDIVPYFHSKNLFFDRLLTWTSHFSHGMPSFTVAYLPLLFPWWFFSLIKVPDYLILKLQMAFLFIAPGFSLYYLTSVIFKKNWHELARITASIFYVFNMFVVIRTPNPVTAWTYILIPLLLGIYIRGLEQSKKNNYYVIYFSVVFMSSSLLVANPPTYTVFILFLVSYFIFRLIAYGKERKKCLVFSLRIMSISLLLSLWWIVPVYQVIGKSTINGLAVIPLKGHNLLNYIKWIQARNSFLNIFWLNTAISWKEFYYPIIPYYSNPLIIVSSYMPVILAFSSMAFKSAKRNKSIIYFMLLSIFSIFIAKGVHPPLSSLNFFLYRRIPGFWLFREPAYKFFLLLVPSYAVLIGFTINEIYNKLSGFNKISSSRKYIIILLINLIIIIPAYPLITGTVIPGKRLVLPSSFVKIPKYWYNANNWINSQSGHFKVLMSPKTPFYQAHYLWGYHAVDLVLRMIDKPILTLNPGGNYLENLSSNNLLRFVYRTVEYESPQNLAKLLGFLNVRFVLQRNDLDWTHYNSSRRVASPAVIRNIFFRQKYINLVKKFDKLDLYEISSKYYYPLIYKATKISLINGNVNDMLRVITDSSFKGKNNAFFLIDQDKPRWEFLKKYKNDIRYGNLSLTFKEINSTKYKVKVNKAKVSYFLIFSESFNPGWKAYYGHVNWLQALWRKPIPEKYHFQVNSYANSWYVDKPGKYEMTLYYKPQSYFYLGLIISLLTLLGCVGYLIWDWRKYRIIESAFEGKELKN